MYQLVCAVVVYDHIQRDDEGWQRLWSDFDGIFDELGIVRMMRDRNGWTGDRVREDITGAFAVAGENRNRRRLIEFCSKGGYVCIIRISSSSIYVSKLLCLEVEMEWELGA